MAIVAEVFFAEVRRSWLIFRRYPIQTIMGLAMTTLLFLGLVFGARYIAGPAASFGNRLEEIIVSYVLWNILTFAMGEISAGLQGEAQVGTLEQIFLAGIPAVWVFLLRAIANQLLIFVLTIGSLLVIIAVTGNRLSFPPSIFLPIFALLFGAYGLGLALGSLSLLYKRIGALMSLSQFGLMALVITPFESMRYSGFARLLPLAPGASLLRDLMARDLPLDWVRLFETLINSLFYFCLGYFVFTRVEKATRARGLLGSY